MNVQLAVLADRYWDTLMEANPISAGLLGDHRFDDRLDDHSRNTEDRLVTSLTALAEEAETIDPDELDRNDRITRRVLLSEIEGELGELLSRTSEYGVDPMLGVHMSLINYIPQLIPLTTEHAEAYLAKAGAVGTYFDRAIARLQDGVSKQRTPPRVAVDKSIEQIDDYLAGPLDADPFMRIRPPDSMTEAEVEAWRDSMRMQVEETVRPGFARYREALADEVLGAARPPEHSGVCWLPDGDQVYARAVKRYTSLDLTPDEIHQIGLDEIASLGEEYRELGDRVLATTDLTTIHDRLRTDPELRFETAAQVKEHAQRALDRAIASVPQWFGRQPEAPCVLREMPEVGAEDQPLAYYLPPATDGSRPGTFFINTTQPTTRTHYESEALAFHEGVPGHHLQIAIAQELEDLPTFRKHALVTVYVEGWGLYTERLCDEMGLYSGDLERLGILSFDSWRAGRLVVDTGIHALGWSRSRAIDYLTDNSPQAPNNIVNEVDRYIGYAGQALAYKLGQREILRLRGEAKDTLGERFDIKGFHDAVLEAGPVPLDLLGELVREWASG